MIKGAIFDMDGTLLDSMHIWMGIEKRYLQAHGIEPNEAVSDEVKYLTTKQFTQYMQEKYQMDCTVEEVRAEMNQMVEEFYRHQVQMRPNVDSLLRWLRDHNVKMCVASATDARLVEIALEHAGLRHYFSEILCCRGVGHSKKEPVIFREAMNHLGTDRSNTVVFEDALYAIRTAAADGFQIAAIYDPSEPGQEEVRKLADVYLMDYEHLQPLFDYLTAMG